MASYRDSLTRMRRFLRDPNGNIWSDSQILSFWNAAQEEVFTKVPILNRVETQRVPYNFHYSYTHSWEKGYLEGDTLQVLEYSQTMQGAICHPFESSAWIGDGPAHSGSIVTHPFEAAYSSPGTPIPNVLHSRFLKSRLVMYDEERITGMSLREIMEMDRFYKTTSGKALHYYRPDETDNLIIIYPRPSFVLSDFGETDVYDDTGGFVDWLTDNLETSDVGIVIEEVGTTDALLIIYYYLPYDIPDDGSMWDDSFDYPPWMSKYVEYATLERAYGADNDGTHGPLRDYWKYRKEVGLNIIKSFKRKLIHDRTFVMGYQPPDRSRRKAQLPSTYPRLP